MAKESAVSRGTMIFHREVIAQFYSKVAPFLRGCKGRGCRRDHRAGQAKGKQVSL